MFISSAAIRMWMELNLAGNRNQRINSKVELAGHHFQSHSPEGKGDTGIQAWKQLFFSHSSPPLATGKVHPQRTI